MNSQEIYAEFRSDMNALDTGELRTLEHELDESDSFRKEAGPEFSAAVHNARDDRVFDRAA